LEDYECEEKYKGENMARACGALFIASIKASFEDLEAER
jgi:hypothetical protein